MFGRYAVKLVLVSSLTISLMLAIYSSSAAQGQEDLFSDVRSKIAGISQKEKETLQKLFTQSQAIDATEKKAAETALEISKANDSIEGLKKVITKDDADYSTQLESLKQVLQYYQRMGPGSYLEILFKSDSLPDLLTRINTLRDLTRNTGKLMDSIAEDRAKQSREKAKLSEELAAVEARQKSLDQTLAEEKKLKSDMESYLSSLMEERGHYQDELNKLQQAWEELKPFISDTSAKLSEFLAKAGLPEDALKFDLSLAGVKISIDDTTINGLLIGEPQLGNMTFSFHPGKVEIDFPDKDFKMVGKFVIIDGHILRFEAEEGSVYGMLLDQNAITGLLQGTNLEFDVKPQLGGFTLKSVDIMEGYASLTI